MKLKGKNTPQHFRHAVDIIQKTGQFNHPMQQLLLDQMVKVVAKVPKSSIYDASVIVLDVMPSDGPLPADCVQAIKDMYDVCIIAECDKVVAPNIRVAFTPVHLAMVGHALCDKRLSSKFGPSITPLEKLNILALYVREIVNDEFPDNAVVIWPTN